MPLFKQYRYIHSSSRQGTVYQPLVGGVGFYIKYVDKYPRIDHLNNFVHRSIETIECHWTLLLSKTAILLETSHL